MSQRSFRLSRRGDSILAALSAKLGWTNKAVIERALELFDEKEAARDKDRKEL